MIGIDPHMNQRKNSWVAPGLAVLAMLLLSVAARNIPFFWDSSYFCEGALNIYQNVPYGLILPLGTDTGGFPMYSLYMALAWGIGGKSLLISHLALLPFLIIIVFQIYIFAKRWIAPSLVKWALVLLLLEPTLVTQSVLMAYDLLLCAFFLLALNAMFSKRKLMFVLFTCLMVLSSVRGIMTLASLAAIHFLVVWVLHQKPFQQKGAWLYLPAVLLWIIWASWHYLNTGWFFVSPEREGNAESLNDAAMFFRQGIYVIWKAIDLGRIVPALLMIGMAALLIIKKSLNKELRFLLLMLLALLIVPLLGMAVFANPVGHRYLLPFIVLLAPVSLAFVSQQQLQKFKYLMIGLVCVAYVSGNFWMYPERFGNGWDASLKVLPWFSLEREIKKDIRKMNIDPREIGTEWPVYTPAAFTDLSDDTAWCNDINGRHIDEFSYIFQTNICNSFHPNTIKNLEIEWVKKGHWSKGQVYGTLYQNPDLVVNRDCQ